MWGSLKQQWTQWVGSKQSNQGTSLPHHTEKQVQGQMAERSALAYLEQRGLRLIERNFHCKGGELDLVMLDDEVLVFVEVRYRKGYAEGQHYGGAAASVTYAKQRRLKIAAQTFLQRYTHVPACRFDVVAMDGGTITWLRDAFS